MLEYAEASKGYGSLQQSRGKKRKSSAQETKYQANYHQTDLSIMVSNIRFILFHQICLFRSVPSQFRVSALVASHGCLSFFCTGFLQASHRPKQRAASKARTVEGTRRDQQRKSSNGFCLLVNKKDSAKRKMSRNALSLVIIVLANWIQVFLDFKASTSCKKRTRSAFHLF